MSGIAYKSTVTLCDGLTHPAECGKMGYNPQVIKMHTIWKG